MNEPMPDVLGMDVEEAVGILAANGYQVSRKTVTKPPWGATPAGVSRVVRQKQVGSTQIELVLAFQNYEKEV